MTHFTISCAGPILAARFTEVQTVLSWSLTRPGFVTTRSVAWLEVSNDDLPLGVDPTQFLSERLETAGYGDAVQMMTSRQVAKHHLVIRREGEVEAACLATVGLSNAGRVGQVSSLMTLAGTINLLVHINQPLSIGAFIEALSVAASARTAAIMELGIKVNDETATGTGTDCIAVAAPCEGNNGKKMAPHAGLHTDIGAVIGGAVYHAIAEGGRMWLAERAAAKLNT